MAFLIFHLAANDEDQVNKLADAEKAESEEIQYPHSDMAGIEAMYAKVTQEEAEQTCYQFRFLRLLFRHNFFLLSC